MTKASILYTLAATALAGVAVTVIVRRKNGATETLKDISEVSVTAVRLPEGPVVNVKQEDLTGKSLAERQNNPGNLRSWPGVPALNGYANFPTLLTGARASFVNFHTYMTKYNLVTLRDIITRWAPESENPTSSYISTVAKLTQLSPDQTLQYVTHARKVLPAMWRVEAGKVFWHTSLPDEAYVAAGRS